jgi:hypothetical protein
MDNNNSQDMDSGTRTDNDKRQITTAVEIWIGLIVGAIAGLVSGGATWQVLAWQVLVGLGGVDYTTYISAGIGLICGLIGGFQGSLLSKRTAKSSILGAIIGGAIGGMVPVSIIWLILEIGSRYW